MKRKNLKNTRIARGMTQTGLGELVGLSKQAICGLESGLSDTTMEHWVALGKALGVADLEWLWLLVSDDLPIKVCIDSLQPMNSSG